MLSPIVAACDGRSACGGFGYRLIHLLDRYCPAAGSKHATQSRNRDFRQHYDSAVRMDEKLDPISRLQAEVIPNALWDRDPAINGNPRLHKRYTHAKVTYPRRERVARSAR